MTTNLEERKRDLIDKIGMLKKEVDILKWPGYKELALHHCMGNVIYLSLDRLHESERHDGHRRTAL